MNGALSGLGLLVLEAHHFETFLSLVPEFRPYLNRRNMYKQAEQQDGASFKRGSAVGLAEGSNSACTTAAFKLASSGKLGGWGKTVNKGKEQRAIFAERWERIVSQLLFNDPCVLVEGEGVRV